MGSGLLKSIGKLRLKQTQTLVIGFIVLILIGALVLNMPFASRSGESIGFISALYTATSVSCVTGQMIVNTAAHWSTFGHIVILLLIQIGGLGVVTLTTTAIMLLQKNIDLRDRLCIATAFGQEYTGGVVRLIQNVWRTTLIIEGCGAVLLTIGFYFSDVIEYTFSQSLAMGVFHSISAFCNAGIDIIGPNGLMPYVSSPAVCIPIMLLIVSGGLGFPVWIELAKTFTRKGSLRLKIERFSVHTKIVFTVTAALIVCGALLFLLFEWDNPATMGKLNWPDKIMASIFQSVTLRTAGFITLNQGGLSEPSRLISCLMMISGGSPSGTAGGIKTTTFAVLFLTMRSALRGKNSIDAFNHEIPLELLQKAICVVVALLIVWLGGTIALYFSENNSVFGVSFLDILFESASISGTVGITTGVAQKLSATGRFICAVSMFLGRLGPVTVTMALTERFSRRHSASNIRLPKTNVIIG